MKYRNRLIVDINKLLFSFGLILTVAFFLVLPLRSAAIRHAIVLFGSIAFYLIAIEKMISSKLRPIEFTSFIAIALIMIFSFLFSIERASFDLVYDSLNFLSFFIIIITDTHFKIDDRLENGIYLAAIFMLAGMVLAFFSPSAYVFEDGRNSGSLVLGMTNPNLTGMMISWAFRRDPMVQGSRYGSVF